MSKQVRKHYRYSFCFKQKVVEEIKQGASLPAVSRKYGIRGATSAEKPSTSPYGGKTPAAKNGSGAISLKRLSRRTWTKDKFKHRQKSPVENSNKKSRTIPAFY
jgi:hypothetical protein